MKDYISLAALIVSIAALLLAYFRNRKIDHDEIQKKWETDFKKLETDSRESLYAMEREFRNRHEPLSERVVRLETSIALFLQNMTITMGNVLHSPHPENARMDYLIEQLQAESITEDELTELIDRLRVITEDRHNKSLDQIAAAFMLMGIERQRDRETFARALMERKH